MTIEFIGSFESAYMPQYDVDVLETSGHTHRWREDLGLLAAHGVTRLRYPIRWHRIENEPGSFNWSETDEVLGHLSDHGFSPIVDLLHLTSYPRWLTGGFADPRFRSCYLRYCEAFATRYPSTPAYTLINEPFTVLHFCGHEGIWPPYGLGMEPFVDLACNVLPAFSEAMHMYRDLLPAAVHVYVDPCEGHSASVREAEVSALVANDRRFFLLDLLLGKPLNPDRPFVNQVVQAGGEALFDMKGEQIDVLGLDYYAHLEWLYDVDLPGACPSPQPQGLAALMTQYWQRYQLPVMLGETNIRGFASDRVSWLKYTLEQCELALRSGIPVQGYCWFPFIDSLDWDSLLTRADRHIDPVGVYWLDENLERRESCMSEAFKLAASGAASTELPAYRFQPPLDRWLRGLLPQMSHWDWVDPAPGSSGMSDATGLIHSQWEVV